MLFDDYDMALARILNSDDIAAMGRTLGPEGVYLTCDLVAALEDGFRRKYDNVTNDILYDEQRLTDLMRDVFGLRRCRHAAGHRYRILLDTGQVNPEFPIFPVPGDVGCLWLELLLRQIWSPLHPKELQTILADAEYLAEPHNLTMGFGSAFRLLGMALLAAIRSYAKTTLSILNVEDPEHLVKTILTELPNGFIPTTAKVAPIALIRACATDTSNKLKLTGDSWLKRLLERLMILDDPCFRNEPLRGEKSVFLSHSSQDNWLACRLYGYLRAAGWNVWLDTEEMVRGETHPTIAEAIASNEVLLVLWSQRTQQSTWVVREVAAASIHGQKEGTPRIRFICVDDEPLPVVLPNVQSARQEDLSVEMIGVNAVSDFLASKPEDRNTPWQALAKHFGGVHLFTAEFKLALHNAYLLRTVLAFEHWAWLEFQFLRELQSRTTTSGLWSELIAVPRPVLRIKTRQDSSEEMEVLPLVNGPLWGSCTLQPRVLVRFKGFPKFPDGLYFQFRLIATSSDVTDVKSPLGFALVGNAESGAGSPDCMIDTLGMVAHFVFQANSVPQMLRDMSSLIETTWLAAKASTPKLPMISTLPPIPPDLIWTDISDEQPLPKPRNAKDRMLIRTADAWIWLVKPDGQGWSSVYADENNICPHFTCSQSNVREPHRAVAWVMREVDG